MKGDPIAAGALAPDRFETPRRHFWRAAGAFLVFALTLALSAGWLFAAGLMAAFSGVFGGVGGWLWAIGYLLVPVIFIVAGWLFPGRRVVAAIGVVAAVVLGVWIARTTPYTAQRMEQILDHAPEPPGGVLVSSSDESGGFGSDQAFRTYRVPAGPDELARYETALTHAGWRLVDSGSSLDPSRSYKKGQLILTIRDIGQGFENSPPAVAGHSYITINAWTH